MNNGTPICMLQQYRVILTEVNIYITLESIKLINNGFRNVFVDT